MLNVSLRELEYVVTVEEERHITNAATRLHMAQPALSQAIKRVERNLGVVLFHRTSRRLVPTPAGTLLAQEARSILTRTAAAIDRVRRITGIRTSLRIHVTEPSLAIPRQILRELRIRHPDLAIHQTTRPRSVVLDELRTGQLDLVIGPRYRHPECESEILHHEEVGILVSAQHPLAITEVVTPEMVADFPIVRIDEEMGGDWNHYVVKLFEQEGIHPEWTTSTVFGALAGIDLVSDDFSVLFCLRSIGQDVGDDFHWRPIQPAVTVPWYLTWRHSDQAVPVMNAVIRSTLKMASHSQEQIETLSE